MKSYGEFMKTKYDEVDREVTTIKDQLFTMTWTSWMDDAWLTETRNDLQSLSSTLGEIVHYDETKVPEKFSGIHRDLVSIATRSRSVVDKYITGIDNRDLGALTEASIKLASLSGELSSFQNKIDQMLPE